MILSDFVLRKQKRACAMRRATSDTAFKMVCRDRRMDRGASSFASMATEDRSKIARTSPPWQGMRMLVAAPQIVFGAIIKFNNYHSQGMSKAKVRGMPQSEVSGKSTATAECEARAARRLSRRRSEIF